MKKNWKIKIIDHELKEDQINLKTINLFINMLIILLILFVLIYQYYFNINNIYTYNFLFSSNE